MNTDNDTFPTPPNEPFEVVMLDRSKNEFNATPDDFKRVAVEATDPLSAMSCAEVAAEEGKFRTLFAAKPNVKTEPEIMAYRRMVEGDVRDRSKI